jgi:hypothetical protein
VVTTGGRRLGEVSDLLINAQTGTFGKIEVMAHSTAGLRTGCLVVCGSEHARIGPDTIVVPDAAIEDRTLRTARIRGVTRLPDPTDHRCMPSISRPRLFGRRIR